MKIFFLDVDGVFTSARAGWYNWDIYAVTYIRWVCKMVGAKVVISSTWRYGHDENYFKAIFGEYLHTDWRTPNRERTISDNCRGHEIQAWLDAHKQDGIENYLILDDDSDMLEDQKENHFIQTDSMEGMLFADMRKIKDFFKVERYPKEVVELHQCKEMFSLYHFGKDEE